MVEEEPRTELDLAQRVRKLKEAEEQLKRAREELTARDRDIRERAQDLEELAKQLVSREEALAARERALTSRPGAAAGVGAEAMGPLAASLEERERRLMEDAKRLKEVSDQLKKREEEWAAKVERFNREAEAELRVRAAEILQRERAASERWQDAVRREEEVSRRERELSQREELVGRREEEAARRAEEIAERGALARGEGAPVGGGAAAAAGDLEELRAELERRRGEVGGGERGVRVRMEEAERRSLELLEREEAVKKREEELRAKEGAAAGRDEELRAREEALTAREEELRAREEALTAREEELRKGWEDLEAERAAREDQAGAAGAAAMEAAQRELEARAKLLEERERALEQFNQELRAAEAINQKRERELEEAERALRERERSVEMETEALATDREAFSQREMEFLRQKAELEKFQEYLRARSLDLDNNQRALDQREAALREEERRASELRAGLEKRRDEMESLEKDLRYHEIHLLTLEEEISDCPYCSTMDGFITTAQLIAEAKGLGADTSEAEKYHKQARSALESGDFDKAAALNRNAMTLAREAKQKYLHYGVKYIISGAETAVKSAGQMGAETAEPEGLLRRARELLDKGDYEGAEQLARRAERMAILAEEKLRELSGTLERLERRVGEVRAYGVDVTEVESAVSAARAMMKEGKRAEAQARLQGVEEILMLSLRRQAAGLRDEARERVLALKGSGADASDAELFLSTAEEKLLEGDYGRCIQCASEASRLASEALGALAPQQPAPVPQPSGDFGGARRGRLRPRVVAATTRVAERGAEQRTAPTPIIHVPRRSEAPAQPLAPPPSPGAYAAGIEAAPLAIPFIGATPGSPPKDYECPSCRGRFTVGDGQRPVLTKCPSCSMVLRIA